MRFSSDETNINETRKHLLGQIAVFPRGNKAAKMVYPLHPLHPLKKFTSAFKKLSKSQKQILKIIKDY